METLYKVLFAAGILFVAAGLVYVMYFLPQAPSTPATTPHSTSYLPMSKI
ncbi:hypothetical protein ACQCN2_01740 [Brevibacillus ginsengisoli]